VPLTLKILVANGDTGRESPSGTRRELLSLEELKKFLKVNLDK
jgi:hypothetical protein